MTVTNPTPLISVVIPNYNSEKFIEATLLSVLNQTYSNIEIHIVDDCSTDQSTSIIKKTIKNKTNCFLHELDENCGGPAEPRNIGIMHAKGDYIAFIDSDDLWHPDKIRFQLSMMKKQNFEFCSSNKVTFNEKYPFKLIKNLNDFRFNELGYSDLIKKNFVAASSVIINRRLFNNLKFNSSKNLIAVEDYDMWLRILKQYYKKILVLHQPTYYYRIQENNISKSKIKMAKKIFNILDKHEKSFHKKLYYFTHYIFRSLIKKYINKF